MLSRNKVGNISWQRFSLMKTIFLVFLVITTGCFSYAGGCVSGITLSNPMLTVTTSNSPSADELNKFYVEMAQDYDHHPEHYRLDQLFGVARGYLAQTKYFQAIPAYIAYLGVQPTNTVAIRELGICFVKIQKYDQAASQFKQGWELGDDVALKDWANVYFMSGRFADIKPLVPDLLKIRDKINGNDNKHEIVGDLIIYSLNAKPSADKEVFLKAIDGLSDEFILQRKDTAQSVILGLKTFGYQERADKLAAELKK
jgi:tetratricopeptide (TPR) repeat protein